VLENKDATSVEVNDLSHTLTTRFIGRRSLPSVAMDMDLVD